MYRLLIADDEDDIRNGLATYFPWNEVGYSVAATAPDGVQALDIVRRGEIDVVLTDIRMPMMNGIELAEAISRERLRVSVVFLSAYKDFDYAQKAIRYGVRRYVLKPTNYREITSVFEELKRELDSGVRLTEGTEASPSPRPRSTRAEEIVRVVREYILRDYARATLDGAARVAHLNPHYLSRLFRAETGELFNDFLIGVKMRKAAELLQDVGYTTYQVSEMVGYSSPKNFSRRFRQHFGVSPREYKRSPDALGDR